MTNGVTHTGKSVESGVEKPTSAKLKTAELKTANLKNALAAYHNQPFGSRSSDVNHLIFFEPLYKRAYAAARALFIDIESLAGAAHQIVQHYRFVLFDLLPQGRARAIQSVVEECVEVQQDGSPIVERREDG